MEYWSIAVGIEVGIIHVFPSTGEDKGGGDQ